MKETVTKAAKKTTGPAVAGPARSAATTPAAKRAGAPKAGTRAAPAAATPKALARTAPAAKAVEAKAVEAKASAVKASAAKPAKAPASTIQPAAAPAKAPAAASKKTVAGQAVKEVSSSAGAFATGGNTAELADKMKTSVVSKVSEVMTKTTKSAPAATTEIRLLSEDEIRAMSEKDYMNAAQLAFFKARLQQLEKDLLKNAGETTEHLRETVLVPDPADRATIEEEHALELRTRDRERKLLKKVQQSIAAIDAGDYGWCEETGEPIGIPRLIARPTATLSLEAQQRRELKQKLYGD
jgi:DnaK suppressor protein